MKPVAAMVATAVLLLTGLSARRGHRLPRAAAAARRPTAAGGRCGWTSPTCRRGSSPPTGPDILTIAGTLTNTGERPGRAVRRAGAAQRPAGAPRATCATPSTATPPPTPSPRSSCRSPTSSRRARHPGAADRCRCAATRPRPRAERTGVHEILVNVNGAPRGGQRARLAAVRMLLPVLSLRPTARRRDRRARRPACAARSRCSTRSPTPAPAVHRARGRAPARRRLAWPRRSHRAGGSAGLVAALAAGAPAGSRGAGRHCVAIDPDLVETAAAMRGGYDVRQPRRHGRPGNGADAAGQWLDQLAADRPRRLRDRAALRRRRPRRVDPRWASAASPPPRSPTVATCWRTGAAAARRCSRPIDVAGRGCGRRPDPRPAIAQAGTGRCVLSADAVAAGPHPAQQRARPDRGNAAPLAAC